jgi:HEAT repeat protein
MSPLGFEITPDIEAEVQADPTRVPSSLQTSERKAELLSQVIDERAAVRHQALTMLTGWDPDPDVRVALRPLLSDDDVHVVRFASMALARQGSPTDLPALLDAVHDMSPADGGTLEAMLGPLMAALDLAALVGPEAVVDVKAKAQAWRVPPTRGRPSETLLEAELDRLLG